MRTSYSTNDELQGLILDLKKAASAEKVNIWRAVATDLSKPTRQRREVNLNKIDRFTENNDVILVPGKVLSSGEITHKVSVAAFNFSKAAKEKILKSSGQILTIKELLKSNPKGKGIKIIG